MATLHPKAYFEDKIVDFDDATLSVASAAVLYGLSIYTVFLLKKLPDGYAAFRLPEHFDRLVNSSRIIGLNTFPESWDYERFKSVVSELVAANKPGKDVFVRVTVHANELVPGVRSRNLKTSMSVFLYDADPILPTDGARLKTSLWRRVPDYAIPSRAKVNGAYVNSVLAKQDAADSGYDDCIFLDSDGQVCELSAANIFLVRKGVLITPGASSDLLEGINRATVLELARAMGIPVEERPVDLTELYVADEIFGCGTSAFISSVKEVDGRTVGKAVPGPVTVKLRDRYREVLGGTDPESARFLTRV